jgi:hypothetical protein
VSDTYTLTEDDFDGGIMVVDHSGRTKISGRSVHTGENLVAYINEPLCTGCDRPVNECTDCGRLTEVRGDPLLAKRRAA